MRVNQKVLIFILTCFILLDTGCNNKRSGNLNNFSENENENSFDIDLEDGTYCAQVEYYNPSTGTRNSYDLDVDVESDELIIIHWPNNGWLDDSHFYPQDISDGQCEFISDKGYHYTVTLGEIGGCTQTDEYRMMQDANAEEEAIKCPNCGGDKETYDDYCYDCKRKLDGE